MNEIARPASFCSDIKPLYANSVRITKNNVKANIWKLYKFWTSRQIKNSWKISPYTCKRVLNLKANRQGFIRKNYLGTRFANGLLYDTNQLKKLDAYLPVLVHVRFKTGHWPSDLGKESLITKFKPNENKTENITGLAAPYPADTTRLRSALSLLLLLLLLLLFNCYYLFFWCQFPLSCAIEKSFGFVMRDFKRKRIVVDAT